MSFKGQQQQPSSVDNRPPPQAQQQQLSSLLPTQIQPHPQHSNSQRQQQQQQSSSTTLITAGEPRKKRAKIVSACAECRRKKTKCNGEQPCRNCEKSGVQCIYPALLHSQHSMADRRSNALNCDGGSAISKAALESIEQRLESIENMLRHIIQSQQQQQQHPQQGSQPWSATTISGSSSTTFTPPLPSLAFQQQQQQRQQQHFSSLSAPYTASHQPHVILQEQQHRRAVLEAESKQEIKLEAIKTEVIDSSYYPTLPPRGSTANTTTTAPAATSISPRPAPNSVPAASIQPPFQPTTQPLLPSIRSLSSYTGSNAGDETTGTPTKAAEGNNSDSSRELPPLLSPSPPNNNNSRNYSTYPSSTNTMMSNAADDGFLVKKNR